MKNIEFIQNDSRISKIQESSSGTAKNRFAANAGKRLKNFIYIAGLAGIGLLANSCSLGYVSTEPVYVESVRPARPSNLHVWIDGDWVYNRQRHAYVHSSGYWERPSENRIYVSGRWQNGPRGQYWEKGHWKRNGNRSNRGRR